MTGLANFLNQFQTKRGQENDYCQIRYRKSNYMLLFKQNSPPTVHKIQVGVGPWLPFLYPALYHVLDVVDGPIKLPDFL